MIKTNRKRFQIFKHFKKDLLGLFVRNKNFYVVKTFISNFLTEKNKRRKKKIDFYKITNFEKPVYTRRKTSFGRHFIKRQQFRLFYSFLRIRVFQKISNKCLKHKEGFLGFIYMMESRLDIILYRLNFVKSLRMARQLIFKGVVGVNNIIIKTPSFNINRFDILFFKPDIIYMFIKKLYNNIKVKKYNFQIIPAFFEINLSNMLFMFNKISRTDIYFFFNLSIPVLNSLLMFYKKLL